MAVVAISTRTFRVSADNDVPPQIRMAPSEVEVVALDFTDVVGTDGTLSATPAWTAASSVVTLGGEGLTNGVTAGVVVTAGSSEGDVVITCRATLATNSREYRRSITIHVRSPL